MSECPSCFRLFCAQCKVGWHADIGCAEYQSLSKDEREKEDIMLRKLAKTKNWQRCPKCKYYVEKSEGCLYMKCRCGLATSSFNGIWLLSKGILSFDQMFHDLRSPHSGPNLRVDSAYCYLVCPFTGMSDKFDYANYYETERVIE
uniref:RING-type domain-containing protein n=1 Tax=Chenopodium quinoa TaxID=63459 RepID=A0A803MFA9_CHEQI